MIRNTHVYRKEAEEGEDLGGEVVDDKAVRGAGEGDSAEPEVAPEILAKAEKMGWTPKDQFKGDPAKWRPADEFVERGENMLPILRAANKKNEREIADLKATVKQFADYQGQVEKKAYDRAVADLKAARAAAIKAGDGEAFDKLDEKLDELKQDAPKAKRDDKEAEDEVFNAWLSKNKWAEDKKLQIVGRAIAEALVEDGETAKGTDLLDLVTKEMKVRYPEKFENQRRNAAPSVEGGAGPRRSGGKSYADLPADARAACDRMAKNGFPDDPKKQADFKAGYVKNYHAEE